MMSVGDPSMIKCLTLLIAAEVLRLAPFDSQIRFTIRIAFIPVFFHLEEGNVQVTVYFEGFFLSDILRFSEYIKEANLIFL